jgi:hypothetical protein
MITDQSEFFASSFAKMRSKPAIFGGLRANWSVKNS